MRFVGVLLFFLVVLIGFLFQVSDKRKTLGYEAGPSNSTKIFSNSMVSKLSVRPDDSLNASVQSPKPDANRGEQDGGVLEFDAISSRAGVLIEQNAIEIMDVIELIEPEPSKKYKILDPDTDFYSLELDMFSFYQSRDMLMEYVLVDVRCLNQYCDMHFFLDANSNEQQLMADIATSSLQAKKAVEVRIVGTSKEGLTTVRLMH